MGDNATSGAGGPVDGSEGQDEERLERIDNAREESRYVQLDCCVISITVVAGPHALCFGICLPCTDLVFQQHTGLHLVHMGLALSPHLVKAGKLSVTPFTASLPLPPSS